MFAMQYLTRPLPEFEKELGTGCHTTDGNSTAIFTPEDWTCKIPACITAFLKTVLKKI